MKADRDLKIRVRKMLSIVQNVAPDKSVVLRIPQYVVIQCVSGLVHRRGTPST